MTGKPEDILRLKYSPRCGYDIAALPVTHRCPECGYAYDPGIVCLEIAWNPMTRRHLFWLSIMILAMLAMTIVVWRFLGTTMLILMAYLPGVLIWAMYVGVKRYRFSKLKLPYVRLIITPRGYRQARGRRMGREKPWHPMHHVHFNDHVTFFVMDLVSRNPKELGLPKLSVPLLIDAAEAPVLRKRIQDYISNVSTESSGV